MGPPDGGHVGQVTSTTAFEIVQVAVGDDPSFKLSDTRSVEVIVLLNTTPATVCVVPTCGVPRVVKSHAQIHLAGSEASADRNSEEMNEPTVFAKAVTPRAGGVRKLAGGGGDALGAPTVSW